MGAANDDGCMGHITMGATNNDGWDILRWVQLMTMGGTHYDGCD
jgi:hypothetical protein